MKIPLMVFVMTAAALLIAPAAPCLAQAGAAPSISHDAVPAAVRGQPLSVIAKVSPGAAEVKAVNLYYTLSKDAAPFKVVMQNSGASVYYGSVPAHLLSSVNEISYYIEAVDKAENTAETDWYVVPVKDARSVEPRTYQPPVAPTPAPAQQTVAPSQPEKKGKMGTALTVGLIGVGAAAVIGGAVYLANSGSSGGGGDDPAKDHAGTYAGSETICFTLAGGTPDCQRKDIRIVIDESGVVRSDSLQSGAALEGRLNGSSFVLVAPVNDPTTNRTGEIYFSGNIVEGRILGSIDGQTTGAEGTGQYTGTFSATKL